MNNKFNETMFFDSLLNYQKSKVKRQTVIFSDKTIHNVPIVRETGDGEWVISFYVFEKLTEMIRQYPDQDVFDYNDIKKGDY